MEAWKKIVYLFQLSFFIFHTPVVLSTRATIKIPISSFILDNLIFEIDFLDWWLSIFLRICKIMIMCLNHVRTCVSTWKPFWIIKTISVDDVRLRCFRLSLTHASSQIEKFIMKPHYVHAFHECSSSLVSYKIFMLFFESYTLHSMHSFAPYFDQWLNACVDDVNVILVQCHFLGRMFNWPARNGWINAGNVFYCVEWISHSTDNSHLAKNTEKFAFIIPPTWITKKTTSQNNKQK